MRIHLLAFLALLLPFNGMAITTSTVTNLEPAIIFDSCEDYVKQVVNEISAWYDADIAKVQNTITALENAGQDATNYYWPERGFVNLYELKKSMIRQKSLDIKRAKDEADCPEDYEKVAQLALDLAIIYYSEGWSLILPPKWTQIDVREVLKGNIAGGKNSFINKTKEDFYKTTGMGKGNTARRILDHPTSPGKWF